MATLGIEFRMIQLQESLDLTNLGKLISALISWYNLSVIFATGQFAVTTGNVNVNCISC